MFDICLADLSTVLNPLFVRVFAFLLFLSLLLLLLREGAFGCAAEIGEMEGCLKRSAETRYILRNIFFSLVFIRRFENETSDRR